MASSDGDKIVMISKHTVSESPEEMMCLSPTSMELISGSHPFDLHMWKTISLFRSCSNLNRCVEPLSPSISQMNNENLINPHMDADSNVLHELSILPVDSLHSICIDVSPFRSFADRKKETEHENNRMSPISTTMR